MIDHDVLKPTSRRDRNWRMVSSGVSGSLLPEGIDSWACHFDSECLAVDTLGIEYLRLRKPHRRCQPSHHGPRQITKVQILNKKN
jgi:hypothetical protein